MKRKNICCGICCTLILCITINKGFSQINLLLNSGMESWSESDLTNWAKESVNLEQESVIKHGGVYSARLQRNKSNQGIYQIVSVTEGHYYTFKAWLYDSGDSSKIGIFINWRNSGGSYLSTTGVKYATTEGVWQYVSVDNKMAPSSAAMAECKVRVYSDVDSSGYSYADDALFYDDVSLPVMMGSLSAEAADDGIVIRWTTESEVDINGFYVLRSEEENGFYLPINTELITAQGNHSDHRRYMYIDRTAELEKGYWYKIEIIHANGESELFGAVFSNTKTGSIVIEKSALWSNYPNPFNPETTIRYRISQEDRFDKTALKIYNIMGQEILTLVDRYHKPGEYEVNWNGCDAYSIPVPSGIYFYCLLSAGRNVDMKRMLKMK